MTGLAATRSSRGADAVVAAVAAEEEEVLVVVVIDAAAADDDEEPGLETLLVPKSEPTNTSRE